MSSFLGGGGGGGGGGMAIGNPVSGATNSVVLFVDGSGNLAQDTGNFTYSTLTIPDHQLSIPALQLTGTTPLVVPGLNSLGLVEAGNSFTTALPVISFYGSSSTNLGLISSISAGKWAIQFNGNNTALGTSLLTFADDVVGEGGGPFVQADVPFILTPVAFAGLPSSPVEGMLIPVTNSNTAVWGATITGTGTNHVLAYYDGTNWTVAAK